MEPLKKIQGTFRHRTGWETAAHVVVWVLFFAWPLIFLHNTDHFSYEWRAYARHVVYPLMAMVVFYLNYAWLVRKLLFEGKTWTYVLVNALLLVLGVLVIHLWRHVAVDLIFGAPEFDRPPRPGHRRITWFFLLQNFLNLLMIVVCAVVLRMMRRWNETRMERQALEQEKSLVELSNLKSQLHPHFLFNTLNNIQALIAIDPDKAQVAVHDLGGLLRYMLKESVQEEVPLSDDVLFIQNYIDLMRLRLGDRTQVEVCFPAASEAQAYSVPPLLFINLVENAFKHGVSARPTHISIKLEVDPNRNRLVFSSRNTLVEREGESISRQDTGVGLVNLQKRLAYIYGGEERFSAGPGGGEFVAELEIPLTPKRR